MFGKYSLLLFNREFSYIYIRNFLFVGIPYFAIGRFLKQHEKWMCSIRNNYKLSISLIFLFFSTTIIERWVLVYNNVNSTRDHYLSTTFLSVSLFIAFTNESWSENRFTIIKLIGRKYSTLIYIIHPLVIIVMGKIASTFRFYNFYVYLQPVIVFSLSVVISYLYYRVKSLFTNKRLCHSQKQ